ncbi:MAG: hypothetical protein FJ217_16205 [Ignavibacteria bacterium]|nr:hypothetical protein [Ignavibacteria bacterium]
MREKTGNAPRVGIFSDVTGKYNIVILSEVLSERSEPKDEVESFDSAFRLQMCRSGFDPERCRGIEG